MDNERRSRILKTKRQQETPKPQRRQLRSPNFQTIIADRPELSPDPERKHNPLSKNDSFTHGKDNIEDIKSIFFKETPMKRRNDSVGNKREKFSQERPRIFGSERKRKDDLRSELNLRSEVEGDGRKGALFRRDEGTRKLNEREDERRTRFLSRRVEEDTLNANDRMDEGGGATRFLSGRRRESGLKIGSTASNEERRTIFSGRKTREDSFREVRLENETEGEEMDDRQTRFLDNRRKGEGYSATKSKFGKEVSGFVGGRRGDHARAEVSGAEYDYGEKEAAFAGRGTGDKLRSRSNVRVGIKAQFKDDVRDDSNTTFTTRRSERERVRGNIGMKDETLYEEADESKTRFVSTRRRRDYGTELDSKSRTDKETGTLDKTALSGTRRRDDSLRLGSHIRSEQHTEEPTEDNTGLLSTRRGNAQMSVETTFNMGYGKKTGTVEENRKEAQPELGSRRSRRQFEVNKEGREMSGRTEQRNQRIDTSLATNQQRKARIDSPRPSKRPTVATRFDVAATKELKQPTKSVDERETDVKLITTSHRAQIREERLRALKRKEDDRKKTNGNSEMALDELESSEENEVQHTIMKKTSSGRGKISASQVDRPRVQFDLTNIAENKRRKRQDFDFEVVSYGTESVPETPTVFTEPTDFSKACRFPRDYLASQVCAANESMTLRDKIKVRNATEKSVQEGDVIVFQPKAVAKSPIRSADSGSVSMDEFLKLESEMMKEEEEEDEKGIPNLSKISTLIRKQLGKDGLGAILSMKEHKLEHFVLLISQPLCRIDGLYVLRASVMKLIRLWGEGPDEITSDNISSYWIYDQSLEAFEPSKTGSLHPNLDAVSVY